MSEKIRYIQLCVEYVPDGLDAFNELARKINEIIDRIDDLEEKENMSVIVEAAGIITGQFSDGTNLEIENKDKK